MTEHKIAARLRNSAAAAKDAAWDAKIWGRVWLCIQIALTVTAVGSGVYLGSFGKDAAQGIGGLIKTSSDPAALVSYGWRTTCWVISGCAAGAFWASWLRTENAKRLGRANALYASLKTLLVDLENDREPAAISRDYQRLTESYPELAD